MSPLGSPSPGVIFGARPRILIKVVLNPAYLQHRAFHRRSKKYRRWNGLLGVRACKNSARKVCGEYRGKQQAADAKYHGQEYIIPHRRKVSCNGLVYAAWDVAICSVRTA